MEATDTMGVRLFDKDRMKEIWWTQQHHINCIQNLPGSAAVQEDRAGDQRGEGGGIAVHVAQHSWSPSTCTYCFVPGTSASDLHFQMYLLERLVKWNEACAVEGGSRKDICYGGQLY